MRLILRILFVGLCAAAIARAQSTTPVLAETIPAQRLAPGGPAVTIDLRNYFAVPGLTATPAGYDSIFPTGGGRAVITFSSQGTLALADVFLSGSTVTITPKRLSAPIAGDDWGEFVLRATDPQGASASATISVWIPQSVPTIQLKQRALSVASGSTVVLDASAGGGYNYRWERDGQIVQEGASVALVITPATTASAGSYRLIASNSFGDRTSEEVRLAVVDTAPADRGRLSNLSILTRAGSGDKALTMGAVIGPLDTAGQLPLVVRAVGPTLAGNPFNVPGTLADPTMTFNLAGAGTELDRNDNWGGSDALRAAFAGVGAFALPGDSLDSAIVRTVPGVGGYTVQVTGKGSAEGAVLAEIYDATGSNRTSDSPRLINVSALMEVALNQDLTVGFVIAGQTARTVLIRGAGPALARFAVAGTMRDPRLELFDNATGGSIGGNDDWAGALEVGNAAQAVGAFPFGSGVTKDAALLVTLPPGQYTARLAGTGGVGGKAIVEVYEVP